MRSSVSFLLPCFLLSSLVACIQAAPLFLPVRRTPAATSIRGGSFFSGKASAPPSSGLFDSIVEGVGEKFQEAVDTGVPTQLTYGFIAGWCSGMALKRVGQTAATVLGIGFVTLQTLHYYGYIEISHDKFKSTVENAFDLNKDGKVDKSDIQQSFEKLMGVLTYNMPSGAGFVGGFLGGVRS